MRKRYRWRLGGAAVVAAAAAIAVGSAAFMSGSAGAACPPGYKPVGSATCLSVKHPESVVELEIRGRQFDAVRAAPHGKTHPGAFSGALASVRQL